MRSRAGTGLLHGASVVAAIALLTTPAMAELPSYQLVDIAPARGGGGGATAINNSGQVVGNLLAAGSCSHAFVYDHGKLSDWAPFGSGYSVATDINDLGVIVGWYVHAPYTCDYQHGRGFVYQDGAIREAYPASTYDYFPLGINNNQQIVGHTWAPLNYNMYNPFILTNGVFFFLGTPDEIGLGGRSTGSLDINESGQIVGISTVYESSGLKASHAFLYEAGTMHDLGSTVCGGAAINNVGQIYFGGFLYTNGVAQPIPCGYVDLNDVGELVGGSSLYTEGTVRDLNTLVLPGWNNIEGVAINNRAQIAGNATNAEGVRHAVLLTPISMLFGDLLQGVTGVGTGKSLADKIELAMTYYDANDGPATCSMLEDFVSQVSALTKGKKLSATTGGTFIAAAGEIGAAIGCN